MPETNLAEAPHLWSVPVSSTPPQRELLRTARQFVTGIVLFLAYFLAAKIGLRFAFVHPSATAVWPPTGISLAALLVLGYRFWPAVFLGAFLVNVTTAGSVATCVAIAAGNTLEGVLGAYLISRFANGRKVFERARDVSKFVLLAALSSTLVSAAIGTSAIYIGGYVTASEFPLIWITWWLGDAAGALIVFPALLVWANEPHVDWRQKQRIEIFLALFTLAAAGAIIFSSWLPATAQPYPLEFVSIPILIWVAFRFGVRETATANLILAIFAITGTLHGFGPFAHGSHNEALLLLQTFLGVIGITTIAVAAEIAERRRLDQERVRSAGERELLLQAERRAHSEAEKSLAMLRRLQTVTMELPGSTQDEILHELLIRLKSATDADIAVVLLLEAGSTDLVAVSTVGFLEPIPQDLRIPKGRGVGGRIAASANGLILNDLPEDKTLSSFFIDRIKSVVGAPIKLNEVVIGVIEVGTFRRHEFTHDDFALIQLIAHRAAFRIERARLDDAERAARKAAEEANRAKDEFLAMLGHELRNPISAISNAVHLLGQAGPLPQLAAKAEGIIARQVEHTKRLVDDLLDVVRVTSGKIVLDRRSVDLAECVSECINGMRVAGEFERHDVQFELSPAWVYADANRIAQVAMNLLSNAVKYTPAGGHIRVAVGPEKNYAQLTVVDSGIGISTELLPRIFDLFTQGDRTLDRAHGGLGLGLTLVKKLTERHGGSVTAASTGSNQGSTFVVTLPRIDTPSLRPQPAAISPLEMTAAPRRIVIIEDNVDIRQGLYDLLVSLGHEVHEAGDGPSGVREALAILPDVALIDIGLPGFDGYEAARRIRSSYQGSEIVLIAVTGYGQRESRQAAMRAGFDHYLVKPIDFHRLNEILHESSAVASNPGGLN